MCRKIPTQIMAKSSLAGSSAIGRQISLRHTKTARHQARRFHVANV
jgi:hypothetical protein